MRLRILVHVSLAAAALSLVTSAGAAPITFAPAALTFDWSKLTKGVPVEVVNETPRPLHLQFRITAFRNAKGSVRLPADAVARLKPPLPTDPLAPGDSVAIT